MRSTRADGFLPAIWLGSAALFFVGEAIAAASVAAPYSYSYVSDYISQLGVPGWTPLAVVMNIGLCVQGVGFLVGAVYAARSSTTGRRRTFIVLASFYGLGLILVAAVPFGVGAPAGELSGLHWLGALFGIFLGNSAILVGSKVVMGLLGGVPGGDGVGWYRRASVAFAIAGFVSFLLLSQPALKSTLGVWERGSVYSVMAWQIFSAVVLLRHHRQARIPGGQPTRR